MKIITTSTETKSLSLLLKFAFSLILLFSIQLKAIGINNVCNANFSHYSIANPDSVHFYPTGSGATSYYWSFGDGTHSTQQNPWHYYSQSGNYYACLAIVDSAGATCNWCDSIHIAPPPPCHADFSHYSIANPDSIHFYPTGSGAASYYWSFGDGTHSTQQNPWHYYFQSGNYYACLAIVDSSGATCNWCDSIHIAPPPPCHADFSHYSISNPDSVHFYPTGSGATSYYWSFGDGTFSSQHYPWHHYSQSGNFYACLSIVDSAGATCNWCDTIHIAPPPGCHANFYHYSLANPDSVHFYPTGSGATSYYWNFGDGTTSTQQNPWHHYLQPGNYYACLAIVDSSGATCNWCDSIHIALPPPCHTNFSHYSLANPDSVHFYPTGTGAASYNWNFGDGTNSTQQYPWHFYSQPGNYYVCLSIVDSAGATCNWCDTIHIIGNHICDAHFAHYFISNPDSIHFYPTGTSATNYYWSFGDGTTSTQQYPWHFYSQPGNYYACLYIVDSMGVSCSWCDSIHISPPLACHATFSHYSLANPDSVHFYLTGSGATSYFWTFGDGTTSTQQYPWHFYSQPGNYYVCLSIVDSAGATCNSCDTIHIVGSHICDAHFAHYSIMNPDSIHFYPTGTNASTYYWSFGDGNFSSQLYPWHYYTQPGNYYACLTITDSSGAMCTSCDSIHIPFPPMCDAHFAHYSISNQDSLHFYPTGSPATSFYWSFGDSTFTNQHAPWHYYQFPGDYLVCLALVDSSNGTNCLWCDSVHVSQINAVIELNNNAMPVVVYPNPSDTRINIIVLNFSQEITISIYNSLGQQMNSYSGINQEIFQFSTEKYASGIYFFNIITDKQIKSGKFMVRH